MLQASPARRKPWYIFSSIGFYPVNPASDEYAISSPVFSKVRIHLANGKTFSIEAPRKSDSEIFIRKQFMNGSVLQFKLSSSTST